MNICFFCGGFNTNGGIGRVTSILADALSRNEEFSIYLCSFYETKTEKYYVFSNSIEKYDLFHTPISMTKAMVFNDAIGKLSSYLRQNKIDILVSCGALYFPMCVIAAKRIGITVFCWEHIAPTVVHDYKFQKQARMYGTRNCDCNIVLTKAALNWYKDNVKNKRIEQIYNPVDPVFSTIPSKSYCYQSQKIISVGRLSYQKNFNRLLDIASCVLPKHSGWTWDIYGDGEERDDLNKKITDLGLQGKVFIKGQVENLYDLYNEYAFFVMTSRYEGFPMVLLEAASCGLPMVSFDIETGPNEIIDNGSNGYLINPLSDSDMVNAIDSLIDDVELRRTMSNNSFKTADIFSIDQILEQWISLFHQFCN